MALVVEQRPEEELFVEDNPTIYDTPYFVSRWNAANLPLVYKISNTKFPVNSEDTIEDVLSVSNNAGFAQLTLDSATYTFFAKGTVQVTNTTNYDGVWTIKEVVDSDNIVINAPFVATETGNVQNYYNNYSTLVKIYAGLQESDPLEAEKPLTLITDNPITVVPNSSNVATVDVSALVKSTLSLENEYDLKDINLYTSFYIEYSEQYDESDGTTVSTTVESFNTDLIDGCDAGGANFITNGDFATNLDDWYLSGSGQDWVYDTGAAQTSITSFNRSSKSLLQGDVGLTDGVEYTLSFDINLSDTEDIRVSVGLGFDIIYQVVINSSQTISFDTIFDGNASGSFSQISFKVELLSTPVATINVRLDNVSIVNKLTNPCLAYIFAIHGALNPQAKYGGNLGEYVANFNGNTFANKWLTLFDKPVLFKGNYFDLSALIPANVIKSAIQAGGFFLQIIEFNKNGVVINETNYPITQDLGGGIYRFRLDDKTFLDSTKEFTAQLLRIPVNLFVDGKQGTFDTSVDTNGNPPSDWNLDKDAKSIVNFDNTLSFEGSASLKFESRSIFNDDYGLQVIKEGKVEGSNAQGIFVPPSLLDFSTQDFSIEIRTYIDLDTIVSSNGEFLYLFYSPGSPNYLFRIIILSDSDFRFQWRSPDNESMVKTPLLKQWMHIVVTFEHGVRAKFSLNGSIDEVVTDVVIPDQSIDVQQGWLKGASGNTAHAKGYHRGMRIFNKALTNTEISNLYNSDAKNVQSVPVSAQPNLIQEFILNQEQSITVFDTSTNDSDLELSNYTNNDAQFGGGAWVDVTSIG